MDKRNLIGSLLYIFRGFVYYHGGSMETCRQTLEQKLRTTSTYVDRE